MKNNDSVDAKIIAMINQAEKPEDDSVPFVETKPKEIPPEERTIYTGIKIDGQWIYFEERTFIEDKIAMMVPTEFAEMPPEVAKVKYPSEQRPGTILTDSSGAVNMMFSYMADRMNNEESEMVRDHIFGSMRRINPGFKSLSTGTEIVSDKHVAYVEFSNPVLDGKLYNLMFFLEVDGRILMGSFNCLTKAAKYWKKAAFEMMQSIQILDLINDERGVQ